MEIYILNYKVFYGKKRGEWDSGLTVMGERDEETVTWKLVLVVVKTGDIKK